MSSKSRNKQKKSCNVILSREDEIRIRKLQARFKKSSKAETLLTALKICELIANSYDDEMKFYIGKNKRESKLMEF